MPTTKQTNNHSEVYDELKAFLESSPSYNLVSYHEHTEQSSNDVLSPSELKKEYKDYYYNNKNNKNNNKA